MSILTSALNREMALETLNDARIGDQLLVHQETKVNLYLVKGRSESLTNNSVTLTLIDTTDNKEKKLKYDYTSLEQLDSNILGVFLSKKA